MSTEPDGAASVSPPVEALARWALGLALVAVATIVLLLATTPDAVDGDPTVDVAARLCLVLAVVAGAFVLVAPLSTRTKAWVVGGLVGVYLFAAAALVLSGTSFPPIGLALDQGFRTASITKYAHSVSLVDFAYKGLPPYYPPLFFWVLGRLAAGTDVTAYEALKIGVLLTALVIPLCAVRFWATITRDWAIAVAVAVTGLAFTDWYEPYGWFAVIVFVPWFLLFVLQVGRRHDLSRGMTAAGMVIGAALVMTYYYPFFIGTIALGGLLAARRPAASHGIALGPKFPRRTLIVLMGELGRTPGPLNPRGGRECPAGKRRQPARLVWLGLPRLLAVRYGLGFSSCRLGTV
jgi:galactan 5-O-arabinofuranosyltransferase